MMSLHTKGWTNMELDAEQARWNEELLGHAREHNVSEVQRLLSQTYAKDGVERPISASIGVLLGHDFVSMAEHVTDGPTIRAWCDKNIYTVVKQCPMGFQKYAQPTAKWIEAVGKQHESLGEPEKLDVLQGASSGPQHVFLHKSLLDDPSLWKSLSPLWIGPKHSSLRQAAIALGWSPGMLLSMVSHPLDATTVNRWGAVLRYPHSLALAAAMINKTEFQLMAQYMTNYTGFVMASRSIGLCDAPEQGMTPANPLDTTLALALLAKAPYPYTIPKNMLVEPNAHDRLQLERVADMHVVLDCLDLLLDGLIEDTIPGFAAAPDQEMQPPNVGEFLFGSEQPHDR